MPFFERLVGTALLMEGKMNLSPEDESYGMLHLIVLYKVTEVSNVHTAFIVCLISANFYDTTRYNITELPSCSPS
jgi:hypothetical protein